MKAMLTILFLSLTLSLKAPSANQIMILRAEAVNPYEAIFKATCQVESSNNPFAIGDRHLKDHSYGLVQVRKVRLIDYYNKTGIMYSEKDMFDPAKAKEVFMWYASEFNPADIKDIVCSWNGGPKWKNKKSTQNYYLKIQKVLLSL